MKTKRAFDHSKYQLWIDPNEVVPYEKNAKIHTDKQVKNIVNSIKRFGWQQDTVLTKDNVLVIGHGRRLAALEIGCEMPYHVIDKNADELTDEDIRELRIADNQTNAETGFDFDALAEDIEDLDFSGFDFDFGLSSSQESGEEKYTGKTDIPQYEPSGEEWDTSDLYDDSKTLELVQEIENSGVDDDVKQFLIKAACRHTRFNYKRIADYYSNASTDVQELMERSALVIIDYDDAIKNGYTKLDEMAGEFTVDEA